MLSAVYDAIAAREEACTSCQCSLQYVAADNGDCITDLLAPARAHTQAATARKLRLVQNISGQVAVQDAVSVYPASAAELLEELRHASTR